MGGFCKVYLLAGGLLFLLLIAANPSFGTPVVGEGEPSLGAPVVDEAELNDDPNARQFESQPVNDVASAPVGGGGATPLAIPGGGAVGVGGYYPGYPGGGGGYGYGGYSNPCYGGTLRPIYQPGGLFPVTRQSCRWVCGPSTGYFQKINIYQPYPRCVVQYQYRGYFYRYAYGGGVYQPPTPTQPVIGGGSGCYIPSPPYGGYGGGYTGCYTGAAGAYGQQQSYGGGSYAYAQPGQEQAFVGGGGSGAQYALPGQQQPYGYGVYGGGQAYPVAAGAAGYQQQQPGYDPTAFAQAQQQGNPPGTYGGPLPAPGGFQGQLGGQQQ